MYEIESKAHVLQRENVIQKLNSFATYGGKSEKKDIYYRIPTEFSPESYVSIRFRTEVFYSQDKTEKITYFTYKKKSIQKDKNSSAIEVNEEHECTISDFSAIETFLKDIGGKISLIKEKITEHWTYILNNEEMHIELCNVPPLGDFLEIEDYSWFFCLKSESPSGFHFHVQLPGQAFLPLPMLLNPCCIVPRLNVLFSFFRYDVPDLLYTKTGLFP